MVDVKFASSVCRRRSAFLRAMSPAVAQVIAWRLPAAWGRQPDCGKLPGVQLNCFLKAAMNAESES